MKELRIWLFAIVGGIFCGTAFSFGSSLNAYSTIWTSDTVKGLLLWIPIWTLLTALLLYFTSKYSFKRSEKEVNKKDYFIYWGILLLCQIPLLLASYPGIFSYDAGAQIITFMENRVTAHHPILHTFILGSFIWIGTELFGSIEIGGCLYSLFQLLLMTAAFAYVCYYLALQKAPKWLRILSLLFFALLPINSFMTICATKDALFSAVFLLFLIQIAEMIKKEEEFFQNKKWQIVFCLHVCLLFALRNNGWHTFLAFIPFLLWRFYKRWKKMSILILICVLIKLVYTGPVYEILEIESGDMREVMSVPIQQVARAYDLVYLDLTEDEKEGLYTVLSHEALEGYNPKISDPVKAYFDSRSFMENPKPFLSTWINIGLRHTKIYVDAFLVNTLGYWYPGNYLEDTNQGKIYFEYTWKNFDEGYNIDRASKLRSVDSFYEGISKSSFEKIPGLGILFYPATYVWILFFATFIMLYRKEYGVMMIVLPLWIYFGTNLLGPVVSVRYVYPMIASTPLMIYLIGINRRNTDG